AHVRFEVVDVEVEVGLGGEVEGVEAGVFCEVGVVGFEDRGEGVVDGADDGGGGVMPGGSYPDFRTRGSLA
ncbi:MAG: hypothetical protein ABI142_05835, partial [Bryocella sp.]